MGGLTRVQELQETSKCLEIMTPIVNVLTINLNVLTPPNRQVRTGTGSYIAVRGPIGNQVDGSPGYYGHRNYGKSGPISWHPKTPIFCHGNPVVCHPSTPISAVSPITPVTPVISHPGGGVVGVEVLLLQAIKVTQAVVDSLGVPVRIPSF